MIAGPIMGFVLWATPVEGVRAIALLPRWCACRPRWRTSVSFAWSGTRWSLVAVAGAQPTRPLRPRHVDAAMGLPAWLRLPLALAVLALGGVAMPRLRIAPGAVDIPHAELVRRVAAALLVAWRSSAAPAAPAAPAACCWPCLSPATCCPVSRCHATARPPRWRCCAASCAGCQASAPSSSRLYLGLAAGLPAGPMRWRGSPALVVASALAMKLQRRHRRRRRSGFTGQRPRTSTAMRFPRLCSLIIAAHAEDSARARAISPQ